MSGTSKNTFPDEPRQRDGPRPSTLNITAYNDVVRSSNIHVYNVVDSAKGLSSPPFVNEQLECTLYSLHLRSRGLEHYEPLTQ